MKSIILRIGVQPSQIAFLKFILEGHDGLALVRTLDPARGVVCLHVAPGCESEVTALLRNLKSEITFCYGR